MKALHLILLATISHLAAGQSVDSEIVNQLHKKKFGWMITKKIDSLELVLEENLKFVHSSGWVQTKRELLEDLKSGKLNYSSVTIDESTVSYNKQSAVVVGKGTFKGITQDKTEFSIKLIYTEVYVKSKKQWKLVSRHASKL